MSAHEDFSRKHEIKRSSDRTFGVIFGVALVILGLLPLRTRGQARWWSVALGGVFLLLAVVTPRALAPLNQLWTALGLLLGRVTTPIVTAVLFYGLITPLAVVLRNARKNPMRPSFEREADSYWIVRRLPAHRRNRCSVSSKEDMSFLAELWQFLRARKKIWLVPVMVVMLLFGVLLVFAPSALAPFIYTLF